MKHRRITAVLASAVIGLGTIAAVESATTSAAHAAGCYDKASWYTTPKKGTPVWIPTTGFASKYGKVWRQGPSTLTMASGGAVSASKTKGSTNTVGGGGGFSIDIFSANATYNHTWDRSVTNSTSTTYDTSFTLKVPSGKIGRARVYKAGWKFPVVEHVQWVGQAGCQGIRTYNFTAVMPVKSNGGGAYLWGVELYQNRGLLKPRG